jgi:cell division septation protein DedD
MDTVFSPAGQAVTLSKKVIPPPVVAAELPRYKESEGFRVQIFAGLDSLNAILTAKQSHEVTVDSVYLIKEKGLFKIQLGDYNYRYQADSANMSLRKNGFRGAWVVKSTVLIPVSAADTLTLPGQVESIVPADGARKDPVIAGKYKVQVVATATIERAETLVRELTAKFHSPVFYEKAGTMYKVFIGPFSVESEARQTLESIRQAGYPDAWLVY